MGFVRTQTYGLAERSRFCSAEPVKKSERGALASSISLAFKQSRTSPPLTKGTATFSAALGLFALHCAPYLMPPSRWKLLW